MGLGLIGIPDVHFGEFLRKKMQTVGNVVANFKIAVACQAWDGRCIPARIAINSPSTESQKEIPPLSSALICSHQIIR